MGVSQSAPSHRPAADEASGTRQPRPYGLAKPSRILQLNSSYCDFYTGIVSLIQNNKYADLVIICGNDRYPVHRAIVCPRSSFFGEECRVRDGEIDLASPGRPTKIWINPSECGPHTLAAVLTFLYTLDYSASGEQVLTFGLPHDDTAAEQEEDGQSMVESFSQLDLEDSSIIGDEGDGSADGELSPTTSAADTVAYSSCERGKTVSPILDPSEPPNELVFHTQMYLASQRFGIHSLCDVAKEKFEKRLRTGPWKVEMVDCIREIYRNGNCEKMSPLKEDIVRSARSRFRLLKTSEGWDELIIDFPEFAAELLRRM